MANSTWMRAAGVAFIVLLGAQLAPYGRDHTNPPGRSEPNWSSPEVKALAQRACFDCHSNETRWPWYSQVAPVSWLVQRDVQEARAKLNFSEWQLPQKEADEAAEAVQEGEMPMPIFLLLHPEARLTDAEKQQLVAGLKTTLGESAHGGAKDRQGHDERGERGEH